MAIAQISIAQISIAQMAIAPLVFTRKYDKSEIKEENEIFSKERNFINWRIIELKSFIYFLYLRFQHGRHARKDFPIQVTQAFYIFRLSFLKIYVRVNENPVTRQNILSLI
jgi:hypothetical protein